MLAATRHTVCTLLLPELLRHMSNTAPATSGKNIPQILRRHFHGKIDCLIELNSFLIKKFIFAGARQM